MGIRELTERDLNYVDRYSAPKAPRDPHDIAVEIARRHGVSLKEIIGPCRYRHVTRARHELYRALRELGWSTPAIGAFVGGRDHTTVLDGLRSEAARTERRRREKAHLAVRPEPHWLGPAGPYVDGLLFELARGPI